jgi:hypothetical protein
MNQQFRPQDLHSQDLHSQDVRSQDLQSGEFRGEEGIVLTPEQARSRRARNIAIGVAVGFFALLFYAVTIAKLIHFGPGFLDRPL